ncbi:MAG: cupin domain-containing protein [Gammaproteobacteria bacterium]|nr:cupin domain-containing protein [Gammaproteobacteria bacterium]
MRPSIKPQDLSREYFFSEGCFITELSNSAADPSLSIARARLEAGRTTRWHRLADTVERYVILAGSGRVEIGDLDSQTVYPGDVVLIPPLCRQRIHNPGPEDLVFLAICSPRFDPSAYQDIDDSPA